MGRRQKYQILDKIDSGGMAEIYRAKAISIQGIEKVVAIKRILPSICKNKKFVTMFLDEARLSMHLAHANVVQVFDLGRSEDSYFIVMEFVDGYNLRRIFQRANEVGQRVPLKIALFLITEMLKGLGHAHELKDASNQPLSIVHRDVSPANVLISRSGEVKLTDFGLAKAITQVELTDPGIVKGKFSYLSPEAIEGKTVDHRADIFSTGIVLWELLANRRLFLGRTEMETVEAIEKLDVPPLQLFNPEVTIDLENILRRALERKPKKRFTSAFEMGETISHYLFSRNLK
ncbi:MAG: serine/threonine protein kinase, partial [Deltaproteobacteria bacterium]|nr:serine/threonine protein kinase [Deltaproteobacteria bacterium]